MGLNGYDYTQQINGNAGLRTQYGIILPPGARVAAFVRSTGIQNGDDTFLAQNLVPTLAQGLARVRPNLGDFVVCLPGHNENVADATTISNAMVAGAKILGVGRGSNMPTLTWSAVGGQITIAVNDVSFSGMKLLTAGNGVTSGTNTTLAFSITGNDVGFYGCEIDNGNGFANATTTFSVSGTASRFDCIGNLIRGTLANGTGTTILISSTGADIRIEDNEILGGATSATGHINVTGATTKLRILRNTMNNFTATSVAAIAFSNVAVTGSCSYNNITVLSTGAVTPGTTGITVGGTNNLVGFFQNFVVNDPNKSGLLLPAVDT